MAIDPRTGGAQAPPPHRPPHGSDGPTPGQPVDQPSTRGPLSSTPWKQGSSITLRSAKDEVWAYCGKTPPTLSGGVGGTETVTIPHGRAAVNWSGHPPFGMKLSLIFDGLSRNKHIEDDIARLIDMALAEPGDKRPPSIRISGPLPYHPQIDGWLIEDLDWGDEVIRREGHTVRLRQDVVVTLIEDAHPDLAIRADKKKGGHGGGHKTRKYTVRKGDTLRKIAARFHVKGGWKALAKLNHLRDPKHLKVGQKLKIPVSGARASDEQNFGG